MGRKRIYDHEAIYSMLVAGKPRGYICKITGCSPYTVDLVRRKYNLTTARKDGKKTLNRVKRLFNGKRSDEEIAARLNKSLFYR